MPTDLNALGRALVALSLIAASGAARADIAAGEWSVSTSVEVPGLPGALGPFQQTECLGAQQAKDPSVLFGAPGGAAAGCMFAHPRDDGSRFSFDLSCGSPGQVSGSGSLRYDADSVDGELKLDTELGGKVLETRFRLEAHRLGPCGR